MIALLIIPGRVKADTLREDALTGDKIDFEPSPDGVFEQHRVIPRRPRAFFRRVHDRGLLVLEEGVDFIDVLSTPSPETRMVQPHTVLHESVCGVLLVAASDSYGSTATDVIDTILAAESTFQTQKGQ